MTDKVAELKAESARILTQMDTLRSRYREAVKTGEHKAAALLEEMAATSRRFRDISERLDAHG